LGDSFTQQKNDKQALGSKQSWASQTKENEDLQEKFDQLDAKYSKDKVFYDKALEARTNQLEEKEDAFDQLLSEKQDLEKKMEEMQSTIEQLQFEQE
jgi:predicted nuclease with TOPRIM domain